MPTSSSAAAGRLRTPPCLLHCNSTLPLPISQSVRLSKALGTPARHSARRLIAVQAAGHSAAAGGSSKGSKGGGSGRRKKGDPHEMTNVDVDPMTSDPGDLGRCVCA